MIFRILILFIYLLNAKINNAQIFVDYPQQIYFANANTLVLKEKHDSKLSLGIYSFTNNFKLAHSFKKNFAAKAMYSQSFARLTDIKEKQYEQLNFEAGVYKFFPVFKDSTEWNKRKKPRKNKFKYAYKPGILFDAYLGYNFGYHKKFFYRNRTDYEQGIYRTGNLNFTKTYVNFGFHLATRFFINLDYNIKYSFLNYKKFDGNFDIGNQFQTTVDFLNDNDPFFLTEHITTIEFGGKYIRPFFNFISVKKPKKLNESSATFDNVFIKNSYFIGLIIDIDDFAQQITGKKNFY